MVGADGNASTDMILKEENVSKDERHGKTARRERLQRVSEGNTLSLLTLHT